MPKYTVLRDKGFPVQNPTHAFGESFTSDEDPALEAGVEQGYLAVLIPERRTGKRDTEVIIENKPE